MSEVLVDYSNHVYTDDELITEVNSIIAHMTGNSTYSTPLPTLTTVAGTLATYVLSVTKAHKGTPTDTSDKNAKRLLVEAEIKTLGAYVQLTSGGDETKILSSGFHTAASKTSIGAFAVVNNFKAITLEASNKVLCSCDAMPKAGFYEVQYTPSPQTADSVWKSETLTKSTIEIDNLPSFVPYVFKMAARGSSKEKNFSATITRAAN
jgi:hypothetical protein